MTINDRLNIYNNLPDEEIMGSFWYIDIIDYDNNKVKSSDKKYNLNNGIADKYIHTVDIPSTNIEYEKTSWGQLNANEFEVQDGFSITFTSNVKATMLSFCEDWLDSIFDRETFRFRSDYRLQGKGLRVVSFRPFNPYSSNLGNNILNSTFSNVVGYVNAIQSTANKFKTLIGKSNSNVKTNENLDNIQICAIYEMQYVYPSKLDDISFSDEDSDRKEFTLNCECAKIKKLYGDNAKL